MSTSLNKHKHEKIKQSEKLKLELPGGRWGVIIPLIIAVTLLLDYSLETKFTPAQILSIDVHSYQVNTDKASFLSEFPGSLSPNMVVGDVIILELSRITETVVAFKPQDSLYVYEPRESVFDYWYIAAFAALISFFLLIRWEKTNYRFELLMLNLIMLTIIGVTYLISH